MPGKAYKSLQNPRMYERIKEQCLRKGKGARHCKTLAAKISNARTPGHRVKGRAVG